MSTIAKASQHAWMYAVLIEMNDYCRNEGLEEVAASLQQAIERMEPVVFPRISLGRTLAECTPVRSAEVVSFPSPR
ncbi:hypothetical protein C8J27_101742 [Rhodobacter aestuarii]|uniref:Uncharacterized protein n=1 Tax=Rhodobacter aestuarii TaxID=453582 RepID=A0A1N7P6Q4_9RHOB|nr:MULTISPECIES: hypothetical protein [Rhodobacter]PTV97625.1 hypothetical protein C8J27_101742 [Rhodobacter aestuarii]SIT06228.1 hypothetical protein SAMN05421580_109102 [Rhodobacter aestuarii]SOC04850.1 hypothetical protein SAMN05877809_103322 [Rhodobacter sp. JA431]